MPALSINELGTYWESLLKKAKITQTTLGLNPKFDVTLLPMIHRKNTLLSATEYSGGEDDKSSIISYFRAAIEENPVKISGYDFVVYIYYNLQKKCNYNPNDQFNCYPSDQFTTFNRSFAGTLNEGDVQRAAFINFNYKSFYGNDGFITIAHELGHAMFNLVDTYATSPGTGQYPEGSAEWDISKWPSRRACLMAKNFPKALYRDNSTFVNWDPIVDPNLKKTESIYIESDLNAYELCAKDIELIRDPKSIYSRNLFTPQVVRKGKQLADFGFVREGESNIELDLLYKYRDPRETTNKDVAVEASMVYIEPSHLFSQTLLNSSGIKGTLGRAFSLDDGSIRDFELLKESVAVPPGSKRIPLTKKLIINDDNKGNKETENPEVFLIGSSYFIIQ